MLIRLNEGNSRKNKSNPAFLAFLHLIEGAINAVVDDKLRKREEFAGDHF